MVDIAGRAWRGRSRKPIIGLSIKSANSIFVNQSGDEMSGHLDMSNHKILNLSEPTLPNDATNKQYTDAQRIEAIKYVDAQRAETQTQLVNDFISKGNSFKEL